MDVLEIEDESEGKSESNFEDKELYAYKSEVVIEPMEEEPQFPAETKT